MRIGDIEARPGEHAFGYLEMPKTRSGISPDLGIHIFAGTEPGPTLLVQGAVHGAEINGSMAILNFVQRLEPKGLRGNVIAVPVINRIGFERGDRDSSLDGKPAMVAGNPRGTISEQISEVYFREVLTKANVLLDLHDCGYPGFERYVTFAAEEDPTNLTEIEQKRRKLVVAFGLDVAAYFQPGTFSRGKPAPRSPIDELGIVRFGAECGGCTGFFKNGDETMWAAERGIWNIMKAMRIIDGEMEADGPLCTIYKATVIFWPPHEGGLFVRKKFFGEVVRPGEAFAVVQDPYTGKEVGQLVSPEEAVVIPSGQNWPAVGTITVGILGVVERIEDRRTSDLYVSF